MINFIILWQKLCNSKSYSRRCLARVRYKLEETFFKFINHSFHTVLKCHSTGSGIRMESENIYNYTHSLQRSIVPPWNCEWMSKFWFSPFWKIFKRTSISTFFALRSSWERNQILLQLQKLRFLWAYREMTWKMRTQLSSTLVALPFPIQNERLHVQHKMCAAEQHSSNATHIDTLSTWWNEPTCEWPIEKWNF